ncbi:MAG: HEAT repeat domain-containing protein, partial [Planctomycetaceae bacterium]|nr:HEAT repeat domain-containing protein [Planctomycetaceae bacterium]
AHQLIVRELEANPRPSTVILALTLLASGSSALRRLALNVLARCEREDDTALMIEALRYAGPDVTGRIVRRMKTIPWMRAVQDSLEQVGEESVVAWVEALVSSSTNGDIGKKLLLLRRCIAIKSELVAKTVIGAMTQHYSSLVRPVLMELREHPYEPVRYYALAALSRTSFDGKHTILKEQLGSDSARIRALAANAIVTNQFDELFARFDAMSEERRRESTSLIKRIDPMLFDKLSERLNSRDVEERLKVLRILTYTGVDEKIEEDLIRAAEDANSRVRASVPYILGRVASPDAARSVLMLLKDFDMRVRANAVEGIELTGRSAFAKVLVPFLGSGIARVRANAAKAMFTLGSQRAQAILDAMAISRQEDMRLAAVWALTRIGSEQTVENALETALRERNQILQRRMMAFIELAQELRREQEKRAASRRLRVVA